MTSLSSAFGRRQRRTSALFVHNLELNTFRRIDLYRHCATRQHDQLHLGLRGAVPHHLLRHPPRDVLFPLLHQWPGHVQVDRPPGFLGRSDQPVPDLLQHPDCHPRHPRPDLSRQHPDRRAIGGLGSLRQLKQVGLAAAHRSHVRDGSRQPGCHWARHHQDHEGAPRTSKARRKGVVCRGPALGRDAGPEQEVRHAARNLIAHQPDHVCVGCHIRLHPGRSYSVYCRQSSLSESKHTNTHASLPHRVIKATSSCLMWCCANHSHLNSVTWVRAPFVSFSLPPRRQTYRVPHCSRAWAAEHSPVGSCAKPRPCLGRIFVSTP